MADPTKRPHKKKSPYTADRGMPGAFEGETVTRRGLMTGGALAAGGIATAAFALPALGFAIGPIFNNDDVNDEWQDVGAETDFNDHTYVAKVITLVTNVGEAGKTTVYIRKATPEDRSPSDSDKPADALRRDLHPLRAPGLPGPLRAGLGEVHLPVPRRRLRQVDGAVDGGPPVRPLDRFYTQGRARPRVRRQALLAELQARAVPARATRPTTSTGSGSTSTRRPST